MFDSFQFATPCYPQATGVEIDNRRQGKRVMGIESLHVAAQAAGFSMVARDDTELGELKNRDTERGLVMNVVRPQRQPLRLIWPFRIRTN